MIQGCCASYTLENFPRLTFDGFKHSRFSHESPTLKLKHVHHSHPPSPLTSTKLATDTHHVMSRSELKLHTKTLTHNAPTVSTYKSLPDLFERTLHVSPAHSPANLDSASPSQSGSAHDVTEESVEQNKSGAAQAEAEVQVKSCHSSTKCGTNIKLWFIKLSLVNFLSDYVVTFKAKQNVLLIKVKCKQKESGFHKIFHSKAKVVSKTLRFFGEIDPKSISVKSDRESDIVVQLHEIIDF